jgi:SAM-dependent methyltransferase
MTHSATPVQAFLAGRPTAPPARKTDLILDLCRGKEVLDLGAIQHSWRMSESNPDWLHAKIRAVAARCVGVDFLADDVAALRERGYDIFPGDVLKDAPPGQFDVVVAGDLVEHLPDPGIFLEYVAKALRADGVAVVTTPSAFYIGQLWTVLFRGRPEISPEHTVWFDPFTFHQLAERSPLQVQEFFWLAPSWWALWNANRAIANLAGRPLHVLTRGLLRLRPFLNSDFAAVLRHRDATVEFDPSRSARQVMEFLGEGHG